MSAISLPWLILAFVLAGLVILLAGTRLARRVDRLADYTGMGDALAVAVFLGATTSLRSILSVVSAAFGHTDLAISNAVGSRHRRRFSASRTSPTSAPISSTLPRRSPT